MTPSAASTHSGLQRSSNEDCYEANPGLGFWLVADGVGGHASGEVASAIVRDTMVAQVAAGASLEEAVSKSHEAVLEEILRRGDGSAMGSTVVALSIKDDLYRLAWVGDSRAYLWNGSKLTRLSSDHTRVGSLLRRGLISDSEVRDHPDRHILTQCLGVSSKMQLKPGLAEGQLGRGQQILLCSDGLTDELSDRAIARELSIKSRLQEQVDGLVAASLAAGGSDNVTVLLVGEPPGDASPGSVDPEITLKTPQVPPVSTSGGKKHIAGAVALALTVLVLIIYFATRG